MNLEYIVYPLIVLFLIVFFGTIAIFVYKYFEK